MQCAQCGTVASGGDLFCASCGAKLGEDAGASRLPPIEFGGEYDSPAKPGKGGAAPPDEPYPPGPPPPSPPPQRRGLWIAVGAGVVALLLIGGGALAFLVPGSDDDTRDVTTAARDTTTAPTTAPPPATETPPTTAPTTTAPTTTAPTTTTVPVAAVVPPPTSGPPFGRWTVIVDSFASCSGGNLFSSEYPSLNPLLCVEYRGAEASEQAALVIAEDCAEDGCYVRYLGSGPISGRWVVLLEALDARTATHADALRRADQLNDRFDLPREGSLAGGVRVLASDDYRDWPGGLWLLITKDLSEFSDAVEWCDEIGLTGSSCQIFQLQRVDGD